MRVVLPLPSPPVKESTSPGLRAWAIFSPKLAVSSEDLVVMVDHIGKDLGEDEFEVVVFQGGDEEEAVESVQHPPMSGDEGRGILYAGIPLHQ